MKVLHRSDWHIGQKFMGKSREEEHKTFLSWIHEIIKNLYIIITVENTDYTPLLKNQQEQEKAFKIWVRLNEMISSRKRNKFAQGITLDQLISLSNNHLILLSIRYELQRSTVQKHLLEIEVIDSF